MKNCNPKNERVKRDYADYLKHAGGKADPTIRQIEKAILRYEAFTGFADFGTFNQQVAREDARRESLEMTAKLARTNRDSDGV